MPHEKFTGEYDVILSVRMTEEPHPEKAIGRILNRMQVIYGDGITMHEIRLPDDDSHDLFGTKIKPYVDKDAS